MSLDVWANGYIVNHSYRALTEIFIFDLCFVLKVTNPYSLSQME